MKSNKRYILSIKIKFNLFKNSSNKYDNNFTEQNIPN